MTSSGQGNGSRELAWLFRTDVLGRPELKKVLDRVTAKSWDLYDSDSSHDFMSSWLTPNASLSIISYGNSCLATLHVRADAADLDREVETAKQLTLSLVLAAVGARDIQETPPPTGE
jgi:hypothetical protein